MMRLQAWSPFDRRALCMVGSVALLLLGAIASTATPSSAAAAVPSRNSVRQSSLVRPLAQPFCRILGPLDQVRFADPTPDYVLLRDADHRIVAEAGSRCLHSAGAARCHLDVVAAIHAVSPSPEASWRIVVERAGVVHAIQSWPALANLLGPIDSIYDAALHVTLHGFELPCGAASAERRGKSWVFVATRRFSCSDREERHLVRVRDSGDFSDERTNLVVNGPASVPDCHHE